jgi:2-methylaconitate cis-trans-isomerase PrpF
VTADDLDVDGTLLPYETDKRVDLLEELESLRVKGAVAMGMANTTDAVPPSIPKICFVSKPASHKILSGKTMSANELDAVVRALSTGQPHRALPTTAGLCVSAAARLEGSVVHGCLSAESRVKTELVVGHPSGKLGVGAHYDGDGKLRKSTVYRTARRLMEG